MKILITGGAGYVGNELVFELLKVPHVEKVIVYDNLSRKNYNLFLDTRYEPHKIQFVKGELLDSRKLKKELQDIDVVFHLAAIVSTPYATENSHLFEQVNHWGTAELIYAIEESNVKKFVYLSTTSVYGASDEIITIDTIPDPKTFYGSSKLRGEKHIERLFDKIDTYIIRCGNVYGYSPSVRFEAVINRFMFEVNFMGRIQINGNGQQTRAFIHVDKVVRVLCNLINPDFYLPSGLYNLVDQNLSIFGIANTIKEIYPHMDMIFVNQHLVMREIKVEKDKRIEPLKTIKPISVKDELINFKNKFSFSSKFDI
ncbi:MAG: NAD-dependent epimerase/dehydratase family protein [Bacteroidetes bacterium]|nr:MAG: NAD-dependent epimerase/dehydratase family protein [Bacteroidota bacterium]